MTNETLEAVRKANAASLDNTLERLGCHRATLRALKFYTGTETHYDVRVEGPLLTHYGICGEERIATRGLEFLRSREDGAQEERFLNTEVPASNYLWDTLSKDPRVSELLDKIDGIPQMKLDIHEKKRLAVREEVRLKVQYEIRELIDWVKDGELERAERAGASGVRYRTTRGAAPMLGLKLVRDLQSEKSSENYIGAVSLKKLLRPEKAQHPASIPGAGLRSMMKTAPYPEGAVVCRDWNYFE